MLSVTNVVVFYFVFCLNSSIVCETDLIVYLLATLNRIKIKSQCLFCLVLTTAETATT